MRLVNLDPILVQLVQLLQIVFHLFADILLLVLQQLRLLQVGRLEVHLPARLLTCSCQLPALDEDVFALLDLPLLLPLRVFVFGSFGQELDLLILPPGLFDFVDCVDLVPQGLPHACCAFLDGVE